MFYFFFESRGSRNDPVVLWLSGGPGCSSSLALFYENGPFKISDNMSLIWNQYGWDQASNIMFVDQPTGTGFSYSSDDRDIRYNEKGISNDLYDFLQAFFSEHSEYVNNDFYITGESYAGHYIPAFASRLHRGNRNSEGTRINLQGFAIGNGLTEPAIQYQAYPDYALDMRLIGKSDYKRINKLYPPCQSLLKSCGPTDPSTCSSARFKCYSIFHSILDIAGNINYYDIRKECLGSLCYNFSNIEKFLNLKSVKSILGVENREFELCSDSVYEALEDDWMMNYEVGIPALLEDGIKLLVYAGEYDLICNWLGNSRWVRSMKWSGQKDFVSSTKIPFMVDGEKKGVLQSHGALSFLKVHRAGHMVPLDQPKAALEMLKRWTQGKLNEIPSNN
ncbi:serine carboxypeptidase 3-like [Ananas comosus]|uniref:Carboxypeptidase n=1 Tax=Ananas comosus TaxID=4615 RepID=A0A6P5FCR5_ANACO|nr:serine carboxypeptidase 3-like [Ananas comosus]